VRCGPSRPHTREGLYAYPDLVVVGGPSQYHDQARDVLRNPTVIVEVLSPATAAFDRGEKFRRYRAWLPTLTDSVRVAQDRPLLDHSHRLEDGTWAWRALAGLQAPVRLEPMGCTGALADVYERIVFPTTTAEAAP
jgi:Putative restriction endonuclease